ncbi:CopD family protein [Rhizobium sp. CFBP 8762]|uniref:CopD family protein n=1 Tax=Rhizobium sp. CFBP 8762 TaxID=2775279 RepID=UPI001780CA42|nr:CopD family protein [Rhizobium sp. CFBP 8762]MBD8556623.1 CopD family protein [Rhizobium sp. CFBP 8762]
MIWIKTLHIAAICLWSAGLLALPGLYIIRNKAVVKEDLYRLQELTRFCYVALISPAAFIAIGSGVALIFLRDAFGQWFHVKLVFVGALVVVHVLSGLVIIRLYDDGEQYPRWRWVGVTAATSVIITAILGVVLWKPDLDLASLLPHVLSEPGGLRRLAEEIAPSLVPGTVPDVHSSGPTMSPTP